MTTRTSIEIQPGLCRVVEVGAEPRRSVHSAAAEAPRAKAADVQVRQFWTRLDVAPESSDFSLRLRQLRQQHALPRRSVVTVWGLRSTHRCVRLAAAADGDLGALAAESVSETISLLEADGSRATFAITPAASVKARAGLAREISLTAASEQQIAQRIDAIVRAGYRVDRVLTPAMALASMARGRADATRGTASIYVALAADATCIAVVRDGLLLMARELTWGYEGDASFSATLVSELRRSQLFFRQSFRAGIESVVLCGDIVGLRTLTNPLAAALELPVQTLDSLTGIDVESMPEPTAAFRADIAALRVVVAAGVECEPTANLTSLKAPGWRRPRDWRLRVFRAAVVGAGALAVIAAIVRLVGGRSSSTRPTPILTSTPVSVRLASRAVAGLHVEPSSRVETAPEDQIADRPSAVPDSISRTEADGESEVVDSIFYLSDRRLAIVNGRIAGVGDRIGSSVVVEIQPRAVVLESPARGRRTIELRAAALQSGRR